MSKDYARIAADVETGSERLAEAIPDAMAGFMALGSAAHQAGSLSPKTKELIALAIAIAAAAVITPRPFTRLAHPATRSPR